MARSLLKLMKGKKQEEQEEEGQPRSGVCHAVRRCRGWSEADCVMAGANQQANMQPQKMAPERSLQEGIGLQYVLHQGGCRGHQVVEPKHIITKQWGNGRPLSACWQVRGLYLFMNNALGEAGALGPSSDTGLNYAHAIPCS